LFQDAEIWSKIKNYKKNKNDQIKIIKML